MESRIKLLLTTDHNSPPPSLVHTFPVLVLHTVRSHPIDHSFSTTVEKAIRAANVKGKNWKEELDVFLLNYCSTPHCTSFLAVTFGIKYPSHQHQHHLMKYREQFFNTIAKEKRKSNLMLMTITELQCQI